MSLRSEAVIRSSIFRILNEALLFFIREFLKRLAFRLRKKEGRKDATEHEQSKYLQNVLDEFPGSTDILKLTEPDLGDNSTELAAPGGDTVAGRTITSGEGFSRDDESGCVGTEVEEEVAQAVKEHKGLFVGGCGCEFVKSEAHDNENDRKHDEAHELDGLATPVIDEKESDPVARNQTSSGQDEVTDADVNQVVINGLETFGAWVTETDSCKDDRRVKTETIVCNIESEPRVSTAEEDLEVLPLAVVSLEVGQRRSGSVNALNGLVLIDVDLPFFDDLGDISLGAINVTLDIHGEARSFRDGETEVQRDDSGNAAETDEKSPHFVDDIKMGDV